MNNPIEHLEFRARAWPRSVAIRRLDGGFSYGGLWDMVRRVACKLRQSGVSPGQVVVTCLQGQTDWVATLALMHEGAATCSNHGYMALPPAIAPDLVIIDQVREIEGSGRTLVLDAAWFDALPEPPAGFRAADYGGGGSLLRLVLTSGTLGQPKVLGITLEQTIGRCQAATTLAGKSVPNLSMLGLSTGGMWRHMMRTLLAGGTYYDARVPSDVIALISRCRIPYLTASTGQVAAVVDVLEERGLRLDPLEMVVYMGAELTPSLLRRLRRVLRAHVVGDYGSTETSEVAQFIVDENAPAGAAGYILPEAALEVVDDEDRPVGAGCEGRVRMRTPHMSAGYYRNPEETRRSFRDGWFYPGDRGRLLEDGMLVLAGRESERINLGGVKINPADVDRVLLEQPGVQDVAAFGYEDHRGLETLAAAIVADEERDVEGLRATLARVVPRELCPSVFVRCEAIPRNVMGKPERRHLRDLYGEAARRAQRESGPRE